MPIQIFDWLFVRICCYFTFKTTSMEKLSFFHEIINFSYFEPLHQLEKLWCHNEYQPKVEYISKYIFWIKNYLTMKLGQIIFIVASNILKKIIVWFGGLHLDPIHFQFTTLPELIKNQIWSCSFLLFWRCVLRQSKIVNIIY